ncbi:MAG: hypothetical protein HY925_04280, partial [Elusimicrobia bacterium]|nr:hypothetical protein [Elusimicrobiota bacterium]
MPPRVKEFLFGKPRDIRDPEVFHKISLVAFLAWVGLGADGLSSSAYGPDEAFRALGAHTHLALILVVMTAATIFVISIAYSNLIEHFPGGGGGYLVATKLLGERAGVVSGCALLVFAISLIPGMFGARLGELDAYVPHAPEERWAKNQFREALDRARRENKPVLVAFTGYACTNCHWMKAN